MSRRDQIVMSDAEAASFLEESADRHLRDDRARRAAASDAALVRRPGHPAASPAAREQLWSWTYAKSQKVRNLERDPRCTLQVEAGTDYAELRGLMLDCTAVIHRELGDVSGVGAELAARYGGADLSPELEAAMRSRRRSASRCSSSRSGA